MAGSERPGPPAFPDRRTPGGPDRRAPAGPGRRPRPVPGRQAATPILELRNVTKHFGGVVAIADLSLRAAAGEVVALVGNNGAGKSTVMRMVCGVHTPDTGEIFVSGQRVRFRSPREARAHGIEAVPQELALAGYLNVAANIFLGREIAWGRGPLAPLNRRKMRARADELVTSFGVHIPDMGTRVRDLSGGQQQGVAISRAMAWGSRLVVLDEPTAALGIHETAQVEEAIGRMSSHGVAVLLVSHQLDQVFRIADSVYVLRHGHLVWSRRTADSSPDEIVAQITGSSADSQRS